MAAIAAIIEWCDPPAVPGSSIDVEAALRAWRSDAVSVRSGPGAALGISAWTVSDSPDGSPPPLVDHERRLAVVADCRLDERGALAAELGLAVDAPDASLIAAGYRRWGDDLPRHLLGDFAGVVWDWGTRRCLAFRDHLGVRPLYYAATPRGITFASDVDLVLPLVKPGPVPDDQMVVEHLLWAYSSTARTFWKGISKLPGGHFMISGTSGIGEPRRYWSPPAAAKSDSSTAQVRQEFQRVFVQSVARRFDSSGLVLAHLSGGIDSSLIVCAADQLRRRPGALRADLAAVSQRFPGTAWDEGDYIAAVREWTGVEGIEWDGSAAEFIDLTAPSPSGPGMRASRASGSLGDLEIANRRSARVILSGEGGDQLGLPWGLADSLIAADPLSFALDTLRRRDLSFEQRVARTRRLLRHAVPRRVSRSLALFRSRRDLPDWLRSRWRVLAAGLVVSSEVGPDESRFEHEIQNAHWQHLTGGRMAFALDAQQVIAARYGVDVRFPFLDRDVVELVLSLGPEHWPRGPAARLHRDAMGSWLPPKVRDRVDKATFSGAVGQLLKRSARQLDALFHEGEWLSGEYVDRGKARRLLERALAAPGERREEHEGQWLQVRAIAALEAWLRCIFGYATPGGRTSHG